MLKLNSKILSSIVFLLFVLTNLYSQQKQIDSLKNLAKKQNNIEKTHTYIKIAEQLTGINLDSAQFYSEEAYKTSLLTKDKRIETITTIQLGNIARENSEYQKALSFFNKSMKMSKEINDSILLANSFSGKGIVYSRLGDFREAIKNMYLSIPIYEKLKDTTNIARGYLNLAVELRKIKEFDKCIEYNLKALKIFNQIKEYINVAAINNNLAGVYNENKNYYKAIEKAEQAKKYFLDNNFIRYTAYPITNLAVSYDSLNKLTEAKEHYLKAIKLHTKNREPYELAYLHNAYSNFNYKQKKYYKAINIGKEGLNFAKEVNALEFITSSSKTLAKSYAKISKFKESHKYLMLHLKSKDSLFQKEKTKDISELELKYKTEKKEKEIVIQKEKILEQELAIKNKSLFAILLASALIILAIIFFSIYKKNQFKRKQLQKEIDLKDALSTIKTQNRLQEQRLRISRDLHDNIGSQLTFIISSIDNLKYISKDANENLKGKLSNISSFTSETIHQLRDTIWAMNKSEISVEDLHARVLSFIEKAKSATENIEFTIEENIDKNTSFSSLIGMNLFRIIQEAINNSIKYAEATKIDILLEKKNAIFEVKIRDNGIGFNINEVNLGNGLSNIEKRISEVNGTATINSKPNNGTEIKVSIHLENTSNDI